MSCEICGRNSCTSSFHSIREQIEFDEYKDSGSTLSFNEWVQNKQDEENNDE